MILQTDKRLAEERPPIKPYGCAFMSMAYNANKYHGYELGIPQIVAAYDDCVEERIMSSDCFIHSWHGLAEYFRFELMKQAPVHRPGDYVCENDEFEILLWRLNRGQGKEWRHFVAGNGKGITTYDPWGVSLTATTGILDSKRIFKLG